MSHEGEGLNRRLNNGEEIRILVFLNNEMDIILSFVI